ncbi:Ig-like domain-containing protein [Cohnella zeiphila]|uniref:Ig-like domain-containing protein n=1 Tax=Cohnella zeiphila TaxID=2761120 RepID=A0A7X0SQL9_9BACL|nr:Ig-like domain-containing protein [Cohnella zeiphila]MBB6734337.1 Ig-like domain-containing protein [Cohnella zeiphila]
MKGLRKVLIAVLLLALCLPAVAASASADSMTTQQKFDFLRDKGIFTGYGDGSAGLNDPMTREQFAAILFRLWSLKEENPAKATYSDVLKSRWSYTNIEAVTKAGLMQGTGNGKFSPLSTVTVEQLATVLVRAYGYEGVGSTQVTGKTSLWARGAVSIALDHQFIPTLPNYTVQASRGLLVEAAYTAYQQMNGGLLSVNTVQPLNNTTLLVTLNQAVSKADTSHFSLKNEQGGTISILQATLSTDGKSITLTTGYETPGIIHTLYIDGDGWRYTAISNPTPPVTPPSVTRPYITSLTNSANGTLQITFQEPVTYASATDPSHYQITAGTLDLKTFSLSADGKTVTIGTAGQKQGVTYQMTVWGVADLAGNVMNTQTNLSFTGIADRTKPTVKSVDNLGNSSLKIVFSERVDSQDATNAKNYRLTGNLKVRRATLDTDGSTVLLYTSQQKDGQSYTLTIRDIADLAGNVMNSRDFTFTGFTDDTKPTVLSVEAEDNSTLQVKFSEKVNPSEATSLANYSIDHGLQATFASLNDAGDTVTLTTTSQQDGVLYRLSIGGISDLAGNEMDYRDDLYFGGIVDRIPPYAVSVRPGVKQVVLTFSERLNAASASNVRNYSIDGGLGAPQSAVYDDARRTVTLTTASQTAGRIYTLTLGQVTDLSGLAVDEDHNELSFVGVDSEYGGTVLLQELNALNRNTVQVTFSRGVTDADVGSAQLAILAGDGSEQSSGWDAYVSRKSGTDSVLTVQFRTDKEPNPNLFEAGKVYIGRVTGVDGLNTDDGANVKKFAGTPAENADPVATQAVSVNNTAVKVTFSEPVRNVAASQFRLLREDGSAIGISSVSVSDPNLVVTEATLYLDDEMQAGRTYRLQFKSGITDAAGWNAIRTKDGSEPYQVVFTGSSSANQAPQVTQASALDRYTLAVQFSEPVQIGNGKGFSLEDVTDQDDIGIRPDQDSVYVMSGDRTKLTIYLDSTKGQRLKSNDQFRLTYDQSRGQVADDQGAKLPTNGGVSFYSSNLTEAAPAIAGVTAKGTQIRIAFSEGIRGYKDQTDFFDIEVNGHDVHPTAGSLQGQTIVLTVPALTAGQIGDLQLSSAGANAIKDYNNLPPDEDQVATFGVQ